MPQTKIKIFWDLSAYSNQILVDLIFSRNFSSSVIATCPVSGSAGETLKDIRAFTCKFGVVTSIKAYWDRNQLRPAEDALYAVMPSMGVNLVDCSSIQGYTNDGLIKMLSGEGACTILMSYHSKYSPSGRCYVSHG